MKIALLQHRGGTSLRAPAVARVLLHLSRGDLVVGGQTLGQVEILGQRAALKAPALEQAFRVTATELPRGWSPVEYNQPLLALEPWSTLDQGALAQEEHAVEGLPPGAQPIEASIDGMFYRSASPEDPPFVKEGDVIAPGQVLGLIEVMKFFYEVKFDRADLGAQVEVLKVQAQDGASIEAGSPILYVAPVKP
jgi:acetyl-CoA carboxylase biotin carboxyl carrier protein